MKLTFLIVLNLCSIIMLHAQINVSKTLNLSAGNLSTSLTTEEKNSIVSLTLSGTIDARDFRTMRDSMPVLSDIDLGKADIVAYSGTQGTEGGVPNDYLAKEIPKYAFFNPSSSISKTTLSQIRFKTNLQSISYAAFLGCTGLISIEIPSTVNEIRNGAFENCSNLKSLYCAAKVPPALTGNVFSGVNKTNCIIYVPNGTVVTFKAAGEWQDFQNIIEMVAYWQFDDQTGMMLSDHSGNGLYGKLAGSTWLIDNGLTCLSFNGTSDCVLVPHNSAFNFGNESFAIEIHFKTSVIPSGSFSSLLSKHNESVNYDKDIEIFIQGGTGVPVFRLSDGTGNFETATGTTNVCDGQFHKVLGKREGNQLKIFVDGKLENSVNTIINPDNENWFNIGKTSYGNYPGSGFFAGIINEISIWKNPVEVKSDTIRTLIITESSMTANERNFVEITNIGDFPVQLNDFTFGNIRPWNDPWIPDYNRSFRLPEKILQPGESYVMATVYDFGPEQFALGLEGYPERVTKSQMWELTDLKIHVPEPNGDYSDEVIGDYWWTFDAWQGRECWYLEQTLPNNSKVIVDQVGGVFDVNGRNNPDGFYQVAGIAGATGNSTLVRKFSVKQGNIDFANARGIGPDDSEWIPLPNIGGAWRDAFWTIGKHGDFNLDANTLESSVINIDFANKTLTVPWGTRENDDIMNYFVKKPGIAWQYFTNRNSGNEANTSAQTGDQLLIRVCGNDMDLAVFNIVVAPPLNNANMVIPKYRTGITPNWTYQALHNDGYIEWPRVTRSASGADTITGSQFGLPFALRTDSLLKYLEKAPKANWEFVWVDGIARPDLKEGDKLRITAQNGAKKEYYIQMQEYKPKHNAYLNSISCPDLPAAYKIANGWNGDNIPNFGSTVYNYFVKLPFDVVGIPAFSAKTSDVNAKVTIQRAIDLNGTEEQRTVIITVTAEDNYTVNTYRVVLTKEQNPANIQPYFGEPFLSELVFWDQWSNSFGEIANPGNQPLDLSNYMIAMAFDTDPTSVIQSRMGTNEWLDRYDKYVPGYKWVNESQWQLTPGILVSDPKVNPIIKPGDVFCFGDIWTDAQTAPSWLPNYKWPVPAQLDVLFNMYVNNSNKRDFPNGHMNSWGENISNTGSPIHKWMSSNWYMFKILNDSVKLGLKPANDPKDFELIERFGMANGSNWVIGGVNGNMITNWMRKPDIFNGNPVAQGSFGTSIDDTEWNWTNQQYWQRSNSGWPLEILNIGNNIGQHFMNAPKHYKSTVTSVVYKVSEGFSLHESIKGAVTGTTVSGFLNNIIKAHESQTLTIKSETGVKAGDAVLSPNDTLVVLAADNSNTTKYIIEVTENGLSANTILTSSVYNVFVNEANSSVSGFGYETTIRNVFENVLVPVGATLTVLNTNNEPVPLQEIDRFGETVDKMVSDQIYFEVVAENKINKTRYQLKPEYNPDEVFVTSGFYSVDQNVLQIMHVLEGTSVFALKANLIPSPGASMKVIDKMNFERVHGLVAIDDKLVVTSANGLIQKIYGIYSQEGTGGNTMLVETNTTITGITSTTAISGGNVLNDGGATVTARGVCWGTDANPTIGSTKTVDGEGTGVFTSTLTGLVSGTTYHVRAFAINNTDTVYGADITFTTSSQASAVIKKTATAPVLDGVIDDVWTTANTYNIDKDFINENPTLGSSGETTWKALWTYEGMYILLTVTDNAFYPYYAVSPSENSWQYDKPELYIDVNKVLADGIGGQGVVGQGFGNQGHYQVAPNITAENENGTLQTDFGNGIEYAFKVNAPNYVAEYFIPFSNLKDGEGVDVDLTGTIGFDVTVIDRDPGDVARNRAVWSNIGAISESWNNMDDAGTITFEGAVASTKIESLTLTGGTITTDNDTLQIFANILPVNASNKLLTWSVAKAEGSTGRATISSTGVLKANLDGVVTVTAKTTDGSGLSASVNVTISGQKPTIDDVNIIRNGNFDMVDNNGKGIFWGGFTDASPAHQVINGVSVHNPVGNANLWYYQFSQYSLNAEPNVPYVLSFVAWADAARTFTVDFEDEQNNYNRYGRTDDPRSGNGRSDWTFNITKQPTRYTFNVTFDQIQSNTVQSLKFFLGTSNVPVYIDSVRLVNAFEMPLNVGLVGTFNNWGNNNSDIPFIKDAANDYQWNLTYAFSAGGEVKFRNNNSWDVNWGNSNFPDGVAYKDGPNIPVLQNFYNISFNSNTGEYNFEVLNVTCNQQDSLALVAIYNATKGPNWGRKDNWLTGKVQTWYGVTMNTEGRVIGLNLACNRLSGYIPSEIGNLTALKRLHLGNSMFVTWWDSWNSLSQQPLPQTLSNLVNLEVLSIDQLWMNNELPDIFGGMTRLRELYIQNNNFTNQSLPGSIVSCANLEKLHIYSNNFNELPIMVSMIKLNDFQAYGCYFSFEDFEPNHAIPGLSYSGQRLVLGVAESLTPITGENISRTVNVGGVNNIYQWLKDGKELEGQNTNTLTLLNVTVADAGIYTLRVTNSLTTQLTLSSYPVILYQSQLPVYKALEALYNSTGGPNWYRNSNWLSNEPISNWQGIYLQPGDGLYRLNLYENNLIGSLPNEFGDLSLFGIIDMPNNPGLKGEIPSSVGKLKNLQYLYLANNSLTGSIPAEIKDCTHLTNISIYNNSLSGLPSDLTGLSLTGVEVHNNKLEFDDIIPWVGKVQYWFNYSPQKKYGNVESKSLIIGSSATFSGLAGGEGNLYQWYKNDQPVQGQTGSELVFASLTAADEGTYSCYVTNPAAPNLTLVSEPKSLYDASKLDAYEPDNHFADAHEITGADYQQHSLFPAGDKDIAWFEIKQPSQVKVWFSNGDWGSRQLSFFGKDTTTVLASGSDYCTFFAIEPGIYYVKAWSQTSETISEYFLDIEITPFTTDGYEPDNNWAEAKQIYPFFPQTDHNLKPAGDVDYVKFEIKDAPRTLTIDVFNETSCRNFNVWLFGTDGVSQLGYSTGGAKNCGARLQYTVSENGTYYLKTKVPWLEMYDNYTISVVTDGQPPVVKCNVQDSLALVAIYNATKGQNWGNRNNWLTGNVLTWYGVTMNIEGRVTGLNLARNRLYGYIPSEIGNLTELKRLHLGNSSFVTQGYSSNNLSQKSLPITMSNLTKLQILSIDNVYMYSELPDIFEGMTALSELYIQNCNFANHSFPGSITSCSNLEKMYIQNNKFYDIPDLSNLKRLFYLSAYGCYFSFEDIEPNLWISQFNYYSQRLLLGKAESLNPATGETISRTMETGGTYNNYQWFKDGKKLDGQTTNTLTLANIGNQDAGIYTLQVTNSLANQLTLSSHPIILYQNQMPVYKALEALYNSTGGVNWNNKTNWLTNEPLTNWFGISLDYWSGLFYLSLYNNNLIGLLPQEIGDLSLFYSIDISYNPGLTGEVPTSVGKLSNLQYFYLYNNKLTGKIPDELVNCSKLIYFSCENNQISGLPRLSGMNSLNGFYVSNNKLEFDDIIPNVGKIGNFIYAPQDSIGESLIYNKGVGESFSYTLVTPGEQNQYQWYKDGMLLDGKTNATLEFSTLTLNDKGKYYCLVTNPQAPNLTLASRIITLNVESGENIKMLALTTPTPLSNNRAFCSLSNNEPITVRFTNTGKSAASNFKIGYSVDGSQVTEETFTGTINPGDSLYYTFTKGANLTPVGYFKSFSIKCYVVFNDDNQADNAITKNRKVFGDYTDFPKWATYNSCDGMLSDISFAIAEDKNGNIWSTDFYGASKFNGTNWTTYTEADGLGDNYSWAMINDRDGNIWFAGANDSIITKYDGNAFTKYPQANGRFNECIYQDKKGNIWFGSYDGNGVVKFDGVNWIHYSTAATGLGWQVLSIGEDKNGNLYFATDNGLIKFDGINWSNFVIPNNTLIIRDIYFDSKGNTWFTSGSKYYRFNGSFWSQFDQSKGTIECEDIAEDIYGSIWFGGGNSIVKYDGATWTKYSPENGLAAGSLSIYAVHADKNGNIWAGSYGGGISKLSSTGNVKMLALNTLVPLSNNRAFCGLSNNETITVRITNNGKTQASNFKIGYSVDGKITEETFTGTINPGDSVNYTFATGANLTANGYYKSFSIQCYLSNNDDNLADNKINVNRKVFGEYTDLPNWTTYNSCDGMLSDISWAIAEDKNGNIWSTDFYGASKFDGTNWTTYTEADGLGENYSWAMINDKNGNIWFTGANNTPVITKYDGTQFIQYPQNGVFEECIFEDSKGNLWFGSWTGSGVLKYDGTNWTNYNAQTTLSGQYVVSIGEDKNGKMYFSTSNGVVVYDGNSWARFYLPGETSSQKYYINEIFYDSKGNTWFTSGSSYFKYDGVNWAQFNQTNGTIDCEDITEDTYGNIWFGGGRKLVKYDGNTFTQFTAADGLAAATSANIYSLHADNNGDIWVGTQFGGISKFAQPKTCPKHFHTVWEGTSGVDHMNINIIDAKYDGLDLEAGDEIGIFDGNLCVGLGKLTKTIDQQNLLTIKASRNDGTGNGYTSGHDVTYKIWDCSAGTEYEVSDVHCFNNQLTAITCLPFEAGATAYVKLSGISIVCQKVGFRTGWNIFSVPASPNPGEMGVLFQPAISNNSLVKIQDESGNSMEDWGIFGGWQDNIGGISPTEGYKIKVNKTDSVEFCGAPVDYPYPIPLKSGWNIMGFPQTKSIDGLNVLQQLIDRGTLLKVQDELGNSIEDWGIFGGWQNNIGNFMAGEGFKIKVITKDTLWIYENYPKSTAILPELVATTHFQPEYEGNGVDHMNINIVGLPLNVLKAGDELAIFDGITCAGAVTIMPHHLKNQTVSISASAADNQGMAGFGEGNQFTLKLWKSSSNQEFVLESEIVKGISTFTKHETTVASLEKYATTGLEGLPGMVTTDINCYPNPFSDKVTVEINLSADSKVQVEVLNQLGQRVKTIITRQLLSGGLHKLEWNGKNANNQAVAPGVYHLRIGIDDGIHHRKIILSE